jgi:tetratricopeptide (TPR) repeat protein
VPPQERKDRFRVEFKIGMKTFTALLIASAAVVLTSCRPSPAKLLATANKYHDNKKYTEADILYSKVIAKDKTNAEAYYREGLNLLSQGNVGQAAQFLRRAVDLKPFNPDAVTKLAEIYINAYLSNRERFRTLLPEVTDLKNKLLQHDPNSFDGLRLQGIIAFAQKQNDQALQSFEKANQIKPYSRDLSGWYAQALLATNQPDKAEAVIRDTLAHDKTWGPGYGFLYTLSARKGDLKSQDQILRERVQNDPKSANARVALADFLVQTKRPDEAESVLKETLNDKADFPNARELMGDFYLRAKRYGEATQQYEAGAQEDSKNSLHYRQRVVLVESLSGKNDDALKKAKALAADNPKDVQTNEMYASLLLSSGLHSDAKQSLNDLKGLVQKDPSNPVLHLDLSRAYLATGDADNALKETLETLTGEAKRQNQRPEVIVPARLIAARIYVSKGQHAQALEQTQQVLQTAPNVGEGRLLRDQALLGLNEVDQAKPDLEKLVAELDKQNAHGGDANEARLLLGGVYAAEKQFPQAIAQFQAVWTGPPQDVRGFESLQRVKIAQGKGDEAVAALADLVNKRPDVLALRYDLANMQATVGGQELRSNSKRGGELIAAAADNYKQILKSDANSAEIWIRLSALQQEQGQAEPALASLEQAINADPKNARAMVERGSLLESLGRKKEAADMYNRALGVDPNNPIALNNLAYLEADQSSNLEQAQSYAERAKKRAPNSPEISDTLGYVYLQRNLNTAALQIFRQDVQDHPENPMYHLHLAMALLKQGDKQGARDEAEKALKNAAPTQQQRIRSFVSQIG